MSGEATAVKTEDGEDSSVPRVLREGDHSTDLTLLVEGRRLHFPKAVLTLCSPVFQDLLTPQYLQQHPEGIPLAGKEYNSVAFFLQLLHPLYSAVTPVSDDRLLSILGLATEYKTDHIVTKCQQHIGSKLELHELKKHLCIDSLLIYLTACEQYHFDTHRATLVRFLSQKTTREIQRSKSFAPVPSTALKDVFLARSQSLEVDLSTSHSTRISQLRTIRNEIYDVRRNIKNCCEIERSKLDNTMKNIDKMKLL